MNSNKFFLCTVKTIIFANAVVLFSCSSDSSTVQLISGTNAQSEERYRLEKVNVDLGVNGVIDEIYVLEYDSNFLSIAETVDKNADGIPEERFDYVYENELLIRSEHDVGLNGVVDNVRSFVFDNAGNLTTENIDDGNDGVVDRKIEYLSNSAGVYAGANVDRDNDGIPDESQRFNYNSSGQITGIEIDVDGDGIADTVTRFIYDFEGKVVSKNDEGLCLF